MYERFDESDLLAWIEGELLPADAAALEAAIAANPELVDRLRSMREDRRILKSTGEVVPPIDFFAELEPMLARPMLMDETPGRYRRGQRRAGARPAARLAAVAGLVLAASAGIWFGVRALVGAGSGGGPGPVALGEDDAGGAGGNGVSAPPAESPSADDPVRHGSPAGTPLPPEADSMLAQAEPASPAPMGHTADRTGGAAVIALDPSGVAPFALVIETQDVEEILRRAVAAVTSGAGKADAAMTLVRNFNRAEARELFARAVRDRQPADGRRVADADPHAPSNGEGGAVPPAHEFPHDDRDFERFLADLREHEREQSAPLGATLAGPEELAPSFEDQLDLSERGADYAIAVPVDRLADLFAQLAVTLGADADVCPFTETGVAPAPEAAAEPRMPRWLADREAVRRAWDAVKARGGVVILPVVVTTK